MNDSNKEFKYLRIDDEDISDTNKLNAVSNKFKNKFNEYEIKEKAINIKESISMGINTSIDKAKCFAEEKNVNDKINTDKIKEVGGNVVDKVSDSLETIMSNETVKSVVSTTSEVVGDVLNKTGTAINNIYKDEKVQAGIVKAKKGTLKVATSAFNGLKSILEEKEVNEESEVSEESEVNE